MTSIRAKDIILLASLLGFSGLGIWHLNTSDSTLEKCLQEADRKREECVLLNPNDEACEAQRVYDYEGCDISDSVGFGGTLR